MAGHAVRKKHMYDWDDYQSWDDGKRWELIAGEAYDMTPAPGTGHQSVSASLTAEFMNHFRSGPCRVFAAPTDVKLSDEDVVQPDILVVCDANQIKPTHVEGAPTLLVEILSPSTEAHDRKRKLPLYARFGVKEVWIISPRAELVEVFVLDGETYRLSGTFGKGDKVVSPTFKTLKVNLARVFTWYQHDGDELSVVKESTPAMYRVKASLKQRRVHATRA